MYGELKKGIVEVIKKLCEMKQVSLINGKLCKYVCSNSTENECIRIYVILERKKCVNAF